MPTALLPFAEFFTVNGKEAECKISSCGIKLKIQPDALTSNVRRHLKNKHPKRLAQLEESAAKVKREKVAVKRQQKNTKIEKVTSYFSRVEPVTKLGIQHPRQKAMTKMLLGAIAIDGLPLAVTEKKYFRQLLLEAEPNYTIPTRQTMRESVLPDFRAKMVDKIRAELSTIDQMYATIDLWTSRSMVGFMGMTVHFIDANYNLKSRVLTCEKIEGRHTAENIAMLYDHVTTRYNITGKIAKVVSDNASSMKKAFSTSLPRLLETKMHEEGYEDEATDEDDVIDEELDLNDLLAYCPQRVSCFAHSVQLVVQDGLSSIGIPGNKTEAIDIALKKVGRIVKTLRRSTCARALLSDRGLHLETATPTRWNSQLRMIESVLRSTQAINEAISTLGQSDQIRLGGLQFNDVSALEELVSLLTPFADATCLTEGQKCVTVSAITPCIAGFRYNLRQPAALRYTESVRQTLVESVERRLASTFLTRDNRISAFLQPSFKTTGLGEEEDEVTRSEIAELLSTKLAEPVCAELLPESSPPAVSSKPKLFSFLDVRRSRGRRPSGPTGAEEALNWYDEQGPEEPLSFWRRAAGSNRPEIQALASVAKVYLGQTATSAPSERLFSKAGCLLRSRRCRMSPEVASSLLLLGCNEELFISLL